MLRAASDTHTLSLRSLLRGQLFLMRAVEKEAPATNQTSLSLFLFRSLSSLAECVCISNPALLSTLIFKQLFTPNLFPSSQSNGEFYWHGFAAAGRTSAEKQYADWPAEENCFDAEARCHQMRERERARVAFASLSPLKRESSHQGRHFTWVANTFQLIFTPSLNSVRKRSSLYKQFDYREKRYVCLTRNYRNWMFLI